jgi:hypothetical protein
LECCDTIVILWENGLGGLGGYRRIFLIFLLEIRALEIRKNPFISAKSAPSVFP